MSIKTQSTLDQAAEDHQLLFIRNPILEKFSELLVPHAIFTDCEREILRRVARPGVSNILLVTGPPGAGKTQLMKEVGGVLNHAAAPPPPDSYAADSVALTSYLPVVRVKANSGRTFESRFKALLIDILKQVNAVAVTLGVARADDSGSSKSSLPVSNTPIAQLEELVRAGLKERRVRAVLIDEAQHLAQRADADDWQLVGNGLKLLGSISGTLIVLFGTSELLSFSSLDGALARRTRAIHFRRYLWNDPHFPHEFEQVVTEFAKEWPEILPPTLLLKHLSFLYTGCVGCIGTLSGWLFDAMALAEQEGLPSVTYEILRLKAHSNEKLRKWDAEAIKCETAFANESAGFGKFMIELCPSSGRRSVFPAPDHDISVIPAPKRKFRPGNRNPTSDVYSTAATV